MPGLIERAAITVGKGPGQTGYLLNGVGHAQPVIRSAGGRLLANRNVEDADLRLELARQLDRPDKQQQLLAQGGLAGIRVKNDRRCPPPRDLAGQRAHQSTSAVPLDSGRRRERPHRVATSAGYVERAALPAW
jgi:hypothetical protein